MSYIQEKLVSQIKQTHACFRVSLVSHTNQLHQRGVENKGRSDRKPNVLLNSYFHHLLLTPGKIMRLMFILKNTLENLKGKIEIKMKGR